MIPLIITIFVFTGAFMYLFLRQLAFEMAATAAIFKLSDVVNSICIVLKANHLTEMEGDHDCDHSNSIH